MIVTISLQDGMQHLAFTAIWGRFSSSSRRTRAPSIFGHSQLLRGIPGGQIANCFHTVMRAPSCLNTWTVSLFFLLPPSNSGWHGSFDSGPLHAPLQNGDELSVSSSDKKRSAWCLSDCITFPSSGHSCVHTSCLTAGSPSLPWPFAVMLLLSFFFFFFHFKRNLGQLGWHAVSLGFRSCVPVSAPSVRGRIRMPSRLLPQAPMAKMWEFGVGLQEGQRCQRGWMASEHTEHIPEGRRGCDFSRLSQGLGYSVCLGVLTLVLSWCLRRPGQQRRTIGARWRRDNNPLSLPAGLFVQLGIQKVLMKKASLHVMTLWMEQNLNIVIKNWS